VVAIPEPTVQCPPTGDQQAKGSIQAQLVDEIIQRWHNGEEARTESALARHPEILDHTDAVLRLIYEEVCLRRERGEHVTSDEAGHRFPRWRAQLDVLFRCHSLLSPLTVHPHWPLVGETVGEFELLAELGRGSQGRVFLASQPGLADRVVVLKLTAWDGQEHLKLAQLQHTHIVPLYAVCDDPERNLRALCMPYYGGTTLHELFFALRETPPRQRSGPQLLETLDGLPIRGLRPLPARGPARRLLARGYVEAVCWIGACLAEALQYAHEHGLLHLDIKPSNVLLTSDGQPMLLDFHLARPPLPAGSASPDWFGGTPGFMAPEHQSALTAAARHEPLPQAIDERSDVYALGLLLYEALGGKLPLVDPTVVVQLPHANPAVSVGLADILRKCLAEKPADRYQQAVALAVDLRRHLHHLPLKTAPNRSLTERWRKWQRRNPNGRTLAMLAATVLFALFGWAGLWVDQLRQRRHDAEQALQQGEQQFHANAFETAVDTLTRGAARAAEVPFAGDLQNALERKLRQARRAREAKQLHDLADRVRFLYGSDMASNAEPIPPPVGQSALFRQGPRSWQTVWERRRALLDRSQGELSAAVEQQLETDLLDLGLIWADLCAREGGERRHWQALQILAEAETLFGPSTVLLLQRQAQAQAVGMDALAAQAGQSAATLEPRSAWEHYALGRTMLQAGDLDRASASLERAVDLQPQGFWPNFYQGICAHRRGQHGKAVSAFSVCIALAPDSAECHYNRALCLAALKESDRALRSYDRALELHPGMASAMLNRGLLHHERGDSKKAQSDLEQALAWGADTAVVHYNLALVHLAGHDRSAALVCVRRALQANSQHAGALQLARRLATPP
jgi:serine/threonine protein kinase/Flp pilus assembly protein TadD